ncbi:MAG: transposase [Bacteroidota bacterium]|nr:transposase [Bacteroidota bacterium]
MFQYIGQIPIYQNMEFTNPGYNPQIHHRRSIRLKGYDYSKEGLYFITTCCQDRICRFGEIVVSENIPTMKLNDAGKMVDAQWLAMAKRFPNIELHDYVIMPNHFHCILEIVGDNGDCTNDENGRNDDVENGRPQGYAPTCADEKHVLKHKTIGDMMDAFKSITTVEYIRGVKNKGWDRFEGKIWQRNYYEHIIRDEQSYLTISDYIIKNPEKWKEDKFHPESNTSSNTM